MAASFLHKAPRAFIQNMSSAAVHLIASDGHTACGWKFSRSRTSTRAMATLSGVPGIMLCETCLPSERTLACALGPAALSDEE